MLSHEELLEHPNYLLSTYQLEIYRQLGLYMEKHKLKSKHIAEKLKVSNAYVSQILNGNFNFTLKKLIELGLMMNKIPYLEFIDPEEYWRREKEGTKEVFIKETHYTVDSSKRLESTADYYTQEFLLDLTGGSLPASAKVYTKKSNKEYAG